MIKIIDIKGYLEEKKRKYRKYMRKWRKDNKEKAFYDRITQIHKREKE